MDTPHYRATASALLLLAASGCVDVRALDGRPIGIVEREEKRFAVTGRPEVDLSTFDGSIEIRAWDQPDVLVVVEKLGVDKAATAAIDVRTEQTGDRVVVAARAARDVSFAWPSHRSARLIVSVPVAADVRATSGDGSISAERVNGRVTLRSGDGSIRARELTGTTQLQTGDGSIRVEDSNGEVDVMTGDGSVHVEGALSRVRARTGDGSLTIAASAGSRTAGAWDIQTGDGSVTLELPDGFGAELDARTSDGRILVRDVAVSNVSGRLNRHTLRGTIGAGGRDLHVRTGDGSITLRRR